MTLSTDWDGELYAANTAHHRRHDDLVLSGLAVPQHGRMLDLCCGVGDLTAALAALVPNGMVLGVDAAQDMVDTANRRVTMPNVAFTRALAQRLDEVTDPGAFDAVVSVAGLHWIPAADQPRVLAAVARTLRPGGVFRASFGGAGQIARLRAVLDGESARLGGGTAPWYFPTVAEYSELLDRAGLRAEPDGWVRLVRQHRSFGDVGSFVGWLRSQVLIGYDAVLPTGTVAEFRRNAEQRAVDELRGPDGTFDQDFIRLDLRAVLPIAL
ncbi:MAG TPA: methyltransferase domain-containing protein [Mycobacteriales bacterium]|nr:methyltransferase domain-containing protein [Mycobacteriales bacterium]